MSLSQNIYQNFLKVTDQISQSRVPLLYEVIPMMDILTQELEKAVKNNLLMPCVYARVSHRLANIDKYYSKTDESIMWKTSMSKFRVSSFLYKFLLVLSSSLTPPLQTRLFPQ